MEELDIPIFKKVYELYKLFYSYRNNISKQDRYTLWQKIETLVLEIIESILLASSVPKSDRLTILEKISLNLNKLRIFVRLAKEVRILDNQKYLVLQENIDEIGRQLGGWIKSTKTV
ncbi:MAG: hypothetical protein A2831_03095 [Candidatus Yanofskybacteria bacterium RIFCSPHIGHO2_01_FULL_44_17]|uniref:bAvd-like domain-containing protein n=1 Tax=Candidatus Yanofskybacteria bacterium RIFCSPHIGHO2_01_FULL_44_17 TaxID=1802668 RepID=A0A1F8ESL6_9BACT|nr:MAG: hypothetical protein A2831_03095 [Candidatus Yanofskybacteria bacterium RIFCSPHIGHO2_01_FULL_44_17]